MGTDRIDWREDAACGNTDPEDFFHIDLSNDPGRRHVQRVLGICAACPVLNECREYALTEDPDPRWAIIGGLLPAQIKALKRNAA